MNRLERDLLRQVVRGDMVEAKKTARAICASSTTKKDEEFCLHCIRELDSKPNLIELPPALSGILVAEDVSNFPMDRFLVRDEERDTVDRLLAVYRASGSLAELGIPYLPALMLYGETGCGKTMLARYIAYKTKLPFLYVRFSYLVESLLGKTQKNLAAVFDYAKQSPCVLCFDEIDAIAQTRGQTGDVGEMNRITIAMMQEMDTLPNDIIIVGTTNRYDIIDPALAGRFPIKQEVRRLDKEEIVQMAKVFFAYTQYSDNDSFIRAWCAEKFGDTATSKQVVRACTEAIVDRIVDKIELEDGQMTFSE